MKNKSYQFQNLDFHERLIEISRLVFDYFDRQNFLGNDVLYTSNLAKGSRSQKIQDAVRVVTDT
jgi:hypothetical protein